jgi:hypothetical protein
MMPQSLCDRVGKLPFVFNYQYAQEAVRISFARHVGRNDHIALMWLTDGLLGWR